MISVITYGRNDVHGYNLPKRAAISLNCIAELLSDPDDEIIFVDYNTPNDLPTFIEAIYDTLTARAKGRLRVLRVRPQVHQRLYQGRTHLAALEPISRNIAIRRSNPRNRWILSTNTDMVFVARPGTLDLTAAVADLADGHYVLPRFDLPEPLWEGWPRMDPRAVIQACDELGTALHLNEVTATYPFIRFDSPGDFQLIPRETLFEVSGFDERMIHGWHVDSNMCRRMAHVFGRTESLADRLKGYHCDHTRVTTLVHRLDLKIENDLDTFVFQLEDGLAPHQATSWGLPDDAIEEVDFVGGPSACFTAAVRAALGAPQTADYEGVGHDTRNYVSYRTEHVLPYVAGYITAHPPSTRFLYAGANRRLLDRLETCLSRMHPTGTLQHVRDTLGSTADAVEKERGLSRPHDATDETFARSLVTTHDVLIFDFGFDVADQPGPVTRITDWPRASRYRLGAVARLLEACAEQCHELFTGAPERAPDFIVVNANPSVFSDFISQFLLTTQTPYNIQVRSGRARLGPDRLYRSHRWKTTEAVFSSFFGYGIRDGALPRVGPGGAIDLTAFGTGYLHTDGHWGQASVDGTWIDGRRAELLMTIDPGHTGDLLARVSVAHVEMPDNEPMHVDVLFEGEPIAHWAVDPRSGAHTHPLVLPSRLFAARTRCRLAFEIAPRPAPVAEHVVEAGCRAAREPRIMIRGVTFYGTERVVYRVGTTISWTTEEEGAFYMNGGWAAPDAYGSWTLGPRAGLTMYLEEVPQEPVMVTFTMTDVAISEEYPHLDVDVQFNGQDVDRWQLGRRGRQEQKVIVTPETLRRQHPLSISFHIVSPRSPADLKWSADPRPLGFRLTSVRIAPVPRYSLGQTIDFTEGGNGENFLWSNWTAPDAYGRWTEGEEATLRFRLDPGATTAHTASFLISDCMVDRESSPRLPVEVLVNGRLVDEWTLGPERTPQVRTLDLAPALLGGDRDLLVAFRVPQPRSPASLGWSRDPRPLGIRLARACLGCSELSSRLAAPSLRSRARALASWARRWR